jgi:diacylglycerol kinase (ATP)
MGMTDDLRVKNRPFSQRLRAALAGIRAGWQRERSFRTQSVAGGAVLALLVVMRSPAIWYAVVILAAGLVLVAELFNAALEALVDRLHPDIHPEIGAVKDMAAGAVLVGSIVALVVGGLYLLIALRSR